MKIITTTNLSDSMQIFKIEPNLNPLAFTFKIRGCVQFMTTKAAQGSFSLFYFFLVLTGPRLRD